VAAGQSNEEIAARLVVSPHTAKTHVNRAMTKLGARDRAQLVIHAYESGLVQPATNPAAYRQDRLIPAATRPARRHVSHRRC
jgi:hypothetical protein